MNRALLIFAACSAFLFSFSISSAQTKVWQPSPGHTQVPIWLGTPPDAQPVPGPEKAGADSKFLVEASLS